MINSFTAIKIDLYTYRLADPIDKNMVGRTGVDISGAGHTLVGTIQVLTRLITDILLVYSQHVVEGEIDI